MTALPDRFASSLVSAVLVDAVRQQRVHGIFSSLVVLPLLNAFILAGLYQTLNGSPFDIQAMASLYPYFIAVTAFVAGGASWEIDLLTGTLPSYSGRPLKAVTSRTTFIVICVVPFLILFGSFRAVSAPDSIGVDLVQMLAIAIGTAVLGIGVALGFGFKTDKSINNLVQVSPWVFALGPSPFFPQGVFGIAWLFPGGGIESGVWLEIARSACYLCIGWALCVHALGPRRAPIYAP